MSGGCQVKPAVPGFSREKNEVEGWGEGGDHVPVTCLDLEGCSLGCWGWQEYSMKSQKAWCALRTVNGNLESVSSHWREVMLAN